MFIPTPTASKEKKVPEDVMSLTFLLLSNVQLFAVLPGVYWTDDINTLYSEDRTHGTFFRFSTSANAKYRKDLLAQLKPSWKQFVHNILV